MFQNPPLTRLFDQVYRQNLNQQIAGLRILEARARLGIAVGLQYPQSQSFGGWQIRESNDYVGSSTKERMRQRTDWGRGSCWTCQQSPNCSDHDTKFLCSPNLSVSALRV